MAVCRSDKLPIELGTIIEPVDEISIVVPGFVREMVPPFIVIGSLGRVKFVESAYKVMSVPELAMEMVPALAVVVAMDRVELPRSVYRLVLDVEEIVRLSTLKTASLASVMPPELSKNITSANSSVAILSFVTIKALVTGSSEIDRFPASMDVSAETD